MKSEESISNYHSGREEGFDSDMRDDIHRTILQPGHKGEGKESLEFLERIYDVKSFDELFTLIDFVGSVVSGEKEYQAHEITARINRFLSEKKPDLGKIPRGPKEMLRNKVNELYILKREKERALLNIPTPQELEAEVLVEGATEEIGKVNAEEINGRSFAKGEAIDEIEKKLRKENISMADEYEIGRSVRHYLNTKLSKDTLKQAIRMLGGDHARGLYSSELVEAVLKEIRPLGERTQYETSALISSGWLRLVHGSLSADLQDRVETSKGELVVVPKVYRTINFNRFNQNTELELEEALKSLAEFLKELFLDIKTRYGENHNFQMKVPQNLESFVNHADTLVIHVDDPNIVFGVNDMIDDAVELFLKKQNLFNFERDLRTDTGYDIKLFENGKDEDIGGMSYTQVVTTIITDKLLKKFNKIRKEHYVTYEDNQPELLAQIEADFLRPRNIADFIDTEEIKLRTETSANILKKYAPLIETRVN